jgi:SulP family sulfate permease
MTPQDASPARSLFHTAIAGGLCGLLMVLYAVSFAKLVFAGPLGAEAGAGVAMALIGTAVLAVLGIPTRRDTGALWQTQGPVVVVLAACAETLSRTMSAAPSGALFATLAVAIICTAVLMGLTMFLVGHVRIAQLARSIPYPVVGGFLAATGYFLLLAAIRFAANDAGLGWHLLAPERLSDWAAPLACAALMVLARRWLPTAAVLPLGTALYAAAVHGMLLQSGIGIEAAKASGLLLGGDGNFALLPVTLSPGRLAGVDVAALGRVVPLILTAVGLAVLGALLNLSAIEFGQDRPMDINAELRRAGLANLAVAPFGGFPGYQSATLTQLSEIIQPHHQRASRVVAAAVVLGVAGFGMPLLGALPRGVFVMLLAYLGIDFLQRWLVFERRRMPLDDYLIVWLILVVAAFEGFVMAVGAGVIVASLRFTVAYSQVDAIRSRTTGQMRLSSTERSPRATSLLLATGGGTLIYEIQGYLFFGTADRIFDRLLGELEAADPPVRRLLLDFGRVSGVDLSAVLMFSRLLRLAGSRGVDVHFSSLSPSLAAQFFRAGATTSVGLGYPTLDAALTALEEDTLSGSGIDWESDRPFQLLLDRLGALGVDLRVELEDVEDGKVVFAKGDRADELVVVASGRLAATLSGPDEPHRRVATFLPGAVVGEIGLFTGGERSATVFAEGPARVWRIGADEIADLKRRDPALALGLTEEIARLMAQRLVRTTALAYAYEL